MPLRLLLGLVAGLASLTPFGPSTACCPIPVPAVTPGAESPVEKLLHEFKALYRVGKYHEAEEVALKARRLDPKHGLANGALFLARRQLLTVKGERRVAEDEKALARRLAATVSVKYDNEPLKRVLEDLADAHGVAIAEDLPAMEEAGVSLDSPISLTLDGVSLKSVLNLVLHQVKLAWVVKDSAVFVTIEEQERSKLVSVAYAVADLVVPIPKIAGQKPSRETTEVALIDEIVTTIAPRSWSDNGGNGLIDYRPLTMSLVVTQAPDIQEQIQDHLAAKRRLLDRQIVLEIRFIRLPGVTIERLGVVKSTKGAPTPTFLDESEMVSLLEAIQGDPRAVVTQAPKLTLFDGQQATISIEGSRASIGEEDADRCRASAEPGFRVNVQAFYFGEPIQANGGLETIQSGFRLNLMALQFADADTQRGMPHVIVFPTDEFHLIPEGKSALYTDYSPGSKERKSPCCPSRAAKKEHYLVLVTPRLIVEKEADEKAVIVPESDRQDVKDAPKPDLVVGEMKKTPAPKSATRKIVYSNRRHFALAYTVDRVGPSGLARLDVYFTRNGENWELHPDAVKPGQPAQGSSAQRTGSVPVEVKLDGLYGFYLVAKNGLGQSKPAPSVGEEAHLWIEVDTIDPEAELYAPNLDNKSGTVFLSWKATDKNLTDDPISLEYAARSDGPWHAIGEARLPNTGRYKWTVPAALPAKVYLRLSVRDRAGNVAIATTPQPILIDTLIPEVRDVQLSVTPAIRQ